MTFGAPNRTNANRAFVGAPTPRGYPATGRRVPSGRGPAAGRRGLLGAHGDREGVRAAVDRGAGNDGRVGRGQRPGAQPNVQSSVTLSRARSSTASSSSSS